MDIASVAVTDIQDKNISSVVFPQLLGESLYESLPEIIDKKLKKVNCVSYLILNIHKSYKARLLLVFLKVLKRYLV